MIISERNKVVNCSPNIFQMNPAPSWCFFCLIFAILQPKVCLRSGVYLTYIFPCDRVLGPLNGGHHSFKNLPSFSTIMIAPSSRSTGRDVRPMIKAEKREQWRRTDANGLRSILTADTKSVGSPDPLFKSCPRKADAPRRCPSETHPLCTQMEGLPEGNNAKGKYGRR